MGRYTWNNVDMIDYHIDNWRNLDVDFIFLDFTNGTQAPIMQGAHALCRRLDERKEGPRVVFWIQKKEDAPLFYREFYKRYSKGLFWQWEGKPLLLIHGISDGYAPKSAKPKPLPKIKNFTARWMWGLLRYDGVDATGSVWTFKERFPPRPYMRNGRAEQIGMAFAAQQTYMTEPKGRRCREGGRFFKSQMANVRKHKPRIVTIASYNEWTAINFGDSADKPVLTDLFTPECSADIEPMYKGHGDKYFKMARQFIRSLR